MQIFPEIQNWGCNFYKCDIGNNCWILTLQNLFLNFSSKYVYLISSGTKFQIIGP